MSTPTKRYDTTLQLHYDDTHNCWKFGDMPAEIWLTQALSFTPLRNINPILITLQNRGHLPAHRDCALGFDSVALADDSRAILHTSFPEAYDQLEKNKARAEQFLQANLDISPLKNMRALAHEFNRGATAKSPGLDDFQFDQHNRTMKTDEIDALFRRAFKDRDGRQAIWILLSSIDLHQKADLDYARSMGIHTLLGTIMEYSGIFSRDAHTTTTGCTNG